MAEKHHLRSKMTLSGTAEATELEKALCLAYPDWMAEKITVATVAIVQLVEASTEKPLS